jgi:DNA-directed RNA polymerase subunit F
MKTSEPQLSDKDRTALHAILEILGLNPEQAEEAAENVIDLRPSEDDIALRP